MSDWKLIEPAATTNLCTNPSFETGVTSWTPGGINTIVQSSEQSKFGVYSAKCTFQDNIYMGAFVPVFSINTVYRLSCWIYIRGGNWTSTRVCIMYEWAYAGSTEEYTRYWSAGDATDEWVKIETVLTLAADAVGSMAVSSFMAGGVPPLPGEYMYFDGFQIERMDEFTTYCDGDQPGCEWNGTRGESTSSRSLSTRSGGIIRDLQTDLDFDIGSVSGAGMPSLDINFDDYTLLPGGEINGVQEAIRRWRLGGIIENTTRETWHASRQELVKLLSPFTVPKQDGLPQPVIFRYTGAEVEKQISAYYDRGLETSIKANDPCYWERAVLTFKSPDPYWYRIGDMSQILDSNDSATFRAVAGRFDQWNPLGPPGAGGAYVTVYDIAYGSDKALYIGGDFVNFDGIGAADNIVKYDLQTETYSALAAGFNGLVRGVAFAPDGDMYAVGSFTDGGGDNDYISRWDGTAWNAVGAPTAGGAAITSIYDVLVDQVGNVYICGDFTTFANVANADYVAMWDGTAWNAVGIPDTGAASITNCQEMAIDSNNNLYVVGMFNNFADIAAADLIAMWDGSAWNDLGFIVGAVQIITIAIGINDIIYVGGNFTGAPGDYIAKYNGTTWDAVGAGVNNVVWKIRIAPDGLVYVTGTFTEAGGIALSRQAIWNGSSWSHLDFNPPGSIRSVVFSPSDPVVESNYDVFIGFSSTGAGEFGGLTTATNDGTARAFPVFVVSRSGGTEAIVETLRNETTGLQLLLNYSLLDGETLTLNLDPKIKSMVSNFFGDRTNAVLPNSDWGEWSLLPGENEVTCFVDTDATVIAYLLWREPFESYD